MANAPGQLVVLSLNILPLLVVVSMGPVVGALRHRTDLAAGFSAASVIADRDAPVCEADRNVRILGDRESLAIAEVRE